MKFTKKHKDIKKKGKELHPTTAMVNNVQREKSRSAVRSVLAWLSTTFPKTFNVEGAIRPLKVGIFEDILAYAEQHDGLPCSKAKLRKALVVFTRRMEYLTCVKMRDKRVDLNGNEVEEVSEEGAKLAVQRIKKTIEKTMRPPRKSSAPRAHGSSRGGERSFRGAQQKRRFSSSSSSPHYGNYNPYQDQRTSRDSHQGGGYFHDSDDQQPAAATIKVKKRYAPRHRDDHHNPYQSSGHNQPEKNYNSEEYNTPLSTVDRIKAKLGIARRKEGFNQES